MNVVVAVVDGHPPDPLALMAPFRQPGAVHELSGDRHPLVTIEVAVLRSRADDAVPHMLSDHPPACAVLLHRQLEQLGEAAEVTATRRPHRRLGRGWVGPPGNQVRVDVLVGLPRPEEVAEQVLD